MEQPNTVFVIDDDPGINEALSRLFTSVNIGCKTYTSGEEFIQEQSQKDGCIILDIRLKGANGIVLQEEIQLKTNMPIIFLTGHGNIQMAVKAMKNGAFDFLTKPFNNQELIDKVKLAIKTNKDQSILIKENKKVGEKLKTLTPRETEILTAIAEGKQTKQIAASIGISINTAQIHRANLMKKMQAKNLGELINMVIKHKSLKH
jgi:two-component system, LuxR family, response regulator FixJ